MQLTPTTGRPMLVHNDLYGSVSLLRENSKPTNHYLQTRTPLLTSPAYVTQAPLDNVVVVQTCRDRETGHCRGFVFQYDDGRVKSVGQCRLGGDETRCVENPARLCFTTVGDILSVVFASNDAHLHTAVDSDAKWECYEMSGTLDFWFNRKQSKISIAR